MKTKRYYVVLIALISLCVITSGILAKNHPTSSTLKKKRAIMVKNNTLVLRHQNKHVSLHSPQGLQLIGVVDPLDAKQLAQTVQKELSTTNSAHQNMIVMYLLESLNSARKAYKPQALENISIMLSNITSPTAHHTAS